MDRMHELVEKLNEYAYQYYTLDNPTVSDVEYDRLYDELLKLEKEQGIVLDNSPTKRVGDVVLKKFQTVKHLGRLYSLDKCQTKENMEAWLDKLISQNRGKMPLCSLEYKFDGLTINLLYREGKLVRAATRGNGIEGEDVTEQVKTIRCVPLSIDFKGTVEVQGEGIMLLSELKKYNEREDVTPLKNARNGVAGAIRNLDPKVTAQRKLEVICYNVNYIEGLEFKTGEDMINFMKENKFKVSTFYKLLDNKQAILDGLDEILSQRPNLDFLIDGAVIKINDLNLRDVYGFTEKFPKWAIAFKFPPEEVTTTLKDVIWQVSRTGKLNPIAVLDPVDLAGVTVSRATLSNISEIRRKDIRINSRVFIRRSNDVIPEITGIAEHTEDSIEVIPPIVCPACGSPVEYQGVFIKCTNKDCAPAIISQMTHFVSREAMDIEGLSEKTLELLYEEGKIQSYADIYALKYADMEGLDSFKDKKISNVIQAINDSKNTTLDRVLFAIGIPNIGKKAAKQLAYRFKTLEAARNATKDELLALDDFGEIMADAYIAFWQNEKNNQKVDRLLELGVKIEEKEEIVGKLTGKIVVLTGSLPTLKRSQAKELIEANGGQTADTISKAVNLVVAGEDAGSKLQKAQKLGIEIIDEAKLFELINNN
ncbi:MAG: NAD-dependent DNA ligase LigA [Clostridiales bacterium]|nr:NAD-dependent DNA ligase LigA [Clostridiales bacterium]